MVIAVNAVITKSEFARDNHLSEREDTLSSRNLHFCPDSVDIFDKLLWSGI